MLRTGTNFMRGFKGTVGEISSFKGTVGVISSFKGTVGVISSWPPFPDMIPFKSLSEQ